MADKEIFKLDDAIEFSNEAFRKAMKRHTQRPVETCLLSGGLDSRQVLSVAQELGQSPTCVTFGKKGADESLYARRVAKKLGLPWLCSGNPSSPPQMVVDDELNLLSLGGGFNGLMFCRRNDETIRGTRCLAGIYLDVVYGPFMQELDGMAIGSYEFSVLTNIFKEKSFLAGFDEALNELRSEWRMMSLENPEERQWQTIARYRARAHHGGIKWKNSFYNWSVIPALDVAFTEGVRTIDGKFMKDRQLQYEAFKVMRPDLAKIPLVGTNHKPRALIEKQSSLCVGVINKLDKRRLKLRKKFLNLFDGTRDQKFEYWKEATIRTQSYLEVRGVELFNIDKVQENIFDLSQSKKKQRRSQRKEYSQRMLVGAVSWLADRDKVVKKTELIPG